MKEEEIKSRVENIFRKMFSGVSQIEMNTSSKDVKGWDSLRHFILITEIEKEFQIGFELDEILSMTTFGEICEGVKRSLS